MEIQSKITKKSVFNVVCVVIFILSLAANVYYFGTRWGAQQRVIGAIQMRDSIFLELKDKGRLLIGHSNGEQMWVIPMPAGGE